MREELEKMIGQFGIRPVLGMVADICRRAYNQGDSLPWGNPAYDVNHTVQGEDLRIIANNLDGELF